MKREFLLHKRSIEIGIREGVCSENRVVVERERLQIEVREFLSIWFSRMGNFPVRLFYYMFGLGETETFPLRPLTKGRRTKAIMTCIRSNKMSNNTNQ